MPPPVPARCDGRLLLAEGGGYPCSRGAPIVLAFACRSGHDGVVRVCDPHGLRVIQAQDAEPGTVCPTCGAAAFMAVYCGWCRRGEHGRCRAYRGAMRAMAGHSPAHAEEYCACSCDPYGPKVPGVPGARDWVEAT